MPPIHFLALWSVVCDLQTADLEAFSRWLWKTRNGTEPVADGPLKTFMTAALELPPQDRQTLSDFVVGAIEARYAQAATPEE